MCPWTTAHRLFMCIKSVYKRFPHPKKLIWEKRQTPKTQTKQSEKKADRDLKCLKPPSHYYTKQVSWVLGAELPTSTSIGGSAVAAAASQVAVMPRDSR